MTEQDQVAPIPSQQQSGLRRNRTLMIRSSSFSGDNEPNQPSSPPWNSAPNRFCPDTPSSGSSFTPFSQVPLNFDQRESNTSKSVSQGIVMVLTMLSCMIAVICSQLQDPCDDSIKLPNEDCSVEVATVFPVINMCVGLTSFVLYFLHVIGQCDAITWLTRNKLLVEVAVTLTSFVILFICNILTVLFTAAVLHETSRLGIFASGSACLSLVFRVLSLIHECFQMLADHRTNTFSRQSSSSEAPLVNRPSFDEEINSKKRSKVSRRFSTFRSKFRRFSEDIDIEASLPVQHQLRQFYRVSLDNVHKFSEISEHQG